MQASFTSKWNRCTRGANNFREGNKEPKYADFGLYLKGKHAADTFRLTFFQLERTAKQERQEPPREEHKTNTGPPKDLEYDHRYDLETTLPLSPIKAGMEW